VRVQVVDANWKELGASPMFNAANAPDGRWMRVRFPFTATTPETRLLFENFSGGGLFEASADDFLVSPQPIPDEPEKQPGGPEGFR
jgi:hypothetical protein